MGKPLTFGIVIVGLSLLDGAGEVDFIAEGNPEIPGARNLRLEPAGAVHRARADGGEPEATALVEAERPDVVVGRGEHHLVAAKALGLGADRLDEHRANALVRVKAGNGGDLQAA